MARKAGLRSSFFSFVSGLSNRVPALEATAIQSPLGDHSGVQLSTEPSSVQIISAGSLPPTRAFITPDGGPCAVNAIHLPSGDQVGAHCAPLTSVRGTGTPPAAGAIQISVASRFFAFLRLWRPKAIRSPSGEYSGLVRNSLSS